MRNVKKLPTNRYFFGAGGSGGGGGGGATLPGGVLDICGRGVTDFVTDLLFIFLG
jgi:hypothetical protein